MRQLIVKLGLNAAGFIKGLGITKASAKAWAKDLTRTLSVEFAAHKIMSSFVRKTEADTARAEADAISKSSSLKRKLAGGFAIGAGAAMAGLAVREAKRVKDRADTSGLGTDELQSLDAELKRTGVSTEEYLSKLDNLNNARRDAVEENPELRKTFADFGVTLRDLRDPMQSNLDLAKQMGAALKEMNVTPEQRNALRDLFGKGGEKFLTATMAIGGSTIDKLSGISPTAIQNVDKASNAIERLRKGFVNLTAELIGRGVGKGLDWGRALGLDKFVRAVEQSPGIVRQLLTNPKGLVGDERKFSQGGRDAIRGGMGFLTFGLSEKFGFGQKFSDKWDAAFDRQTAGQPITREAGWVGPEGGTIGPLADPMFVMQEEKELLKLTEQLMREREKTDFDRLNRLEQEKKLQEEIALSIARAAELEKLGDPASLLEATKERINAENWQQQLDALGGNGLPPLENPFGMDARSRGNLLQSASDAVPVLDVMIGIQREQLNTQKRIEAKLTNRPPMLDAGAGAMDQLNRAFA